MLAVAATWVVPIQIATWDFVVPDPSTGDLRNGSFLSVAMGTHVINRISPQSYPHLCTTVMTNLGLWSVTSVSQGHILVSGRGSRPTL